jgi:hypothetical protein
MNIKTIIKYGFYWIFIGFWTLNIENIVKIKYFEITFLINYI